MQATAYAEKKCAGRPDILQLQIIRNKQIILWIFEAFERRNNNGRGFAPKRFLKNNKFGRAPEGGKANGD